MNPGADTPISAVPKEQDPVQWVKAHYGDAASQIVGFFSGDNFELEGKKIADIGCGDGLTDLGVFHKANPDVLVGYDLRETDRDALLRTAQAAGIADELPDSDELSFVMSGVDYIPAPDNTFDFAYSWSVFEHVSDPVTMFSEIRRILKPKGVFMLQIWPLWFSEHGGHLWMNYDEPFPHLRNEDGEIVEYLLGKEGTDPGRPADDEYRSLNRVTADDLQRGILAGGMRVTKVELQTGAVHIPQDLSHIPLSSLAISGIKLLATPA